MNAERMILCLRNPQEIFGKSSEIPVMTSLMMSPMTSSTRGFPALNRFIYEVTKLSVLSLDNSEL